jgi:hypothetical protein
MKRILLSLVLLTAISLTALCGQDFRFDIGVHGSPSLVFLSGNSFLKNNSKPTLGYMVGGHLQYNFRRIVSIRTEVNFESKGTHENSTTTYSQQVHNFQYVNVPILLRLTFGHKLFFMINAGPYVGALIKDVVTTEQAIGSSSTSDYTNNFSRFDAGLVGGLGLGVTIAKRLVISFEARQNFGLYDINRNTTVDGFAGTVRTNSTNFILGLSLKIGKRSGGATAATGDK